MTLYEAVNRVLKRLDDYPAVGGERVWSRDEVERYVLDGLRAFSRQTRFCFDMFYPENLALSGNYSAEWELDYFDPGMIAVGLAGYTGGYWEKDYAQAGAIGPVNLTQPWEVEYIETTFAVAPQPLPEETVAVERVTHNWHEMSPEFTRWFEESDRSFQTTTGDAWRYSLDRDGLNRLRTVPAGNGSAETFTVTGTFGLLRYAGASELGTWLPTGTWGTLRTIPQHFPMGETFGIPRRLYSDSANTRVEYFRVADVTEVPSRWVKYAEFYACARCSERDGPGQDLDRAEHYRSRFDEGVRRMRERLTEHRQAVTHQVGATGRAQTRSALARLPYRYGRPIRHGY